MSNEITTTPQANDNVVVQMAAAHGFTEAEYAETLIQTIFPQRKATKQEVWAICIVANEYKLNPLTREIYAFPGKNGIIPIISADGWYTIMQRHPEFDGFKHEFIDDDKGNVVACRCIIYTKNRSHPIEVIEYVSENKRPTDPWNRQPRRMIRHRATIQAVRMGFGISAMDPEDAERIPDYESADSPVQRGRDAEASALEKARERARGKIEPKVEAKVVDITPEVEPEPVEPEPVEPEVVVEPKPEPKPVAPEPKKAAAPAKKARKAKAVKAQKDEFLTYLDDPAVDDSLISPNLPPEGEFYDEAFATMWKDDAEKLLVQLRAGAFRIPVTETAEAAPPEPEEGSAPSAAPAESVEFDL